MVKKQVPEVWTVMFTSWIADKFEIGDNVTIVQKQKTKNKGLTMVTIMPHSCGRPKQDTTEARRRKKDGPDNPL